MKFEGIKMFPLLELGLSQIYLNEDKIKAIEKWFDPNEMSKVEPLPVYDFGNGKYTLTDGHTRAYAAYKNGLTHVPIIYDDDDMVAGELGKQLYSLDIEWCGRFQLFDISCLQKRILTNEEIKIIVDELLFDTSLGRIFYFYHDPMRSWKYIGPVRKL